MRDDPWRDLAPPSSKTAISAHRVDEANPWDLFWAIDHAGCCLLVLRHAPEATPRQRLPRLREIEVREEAAVQEGRSMLVLRLLDPALRDVFYRLCLDIASATTRCSAETEAVDAAVARTWRWHHLLRGGGAGLLRPEEQKGLIGELLVLEQYMLPTLGAAAAVEAWRGPIGAAKDFVSGSVGVESKARGRLDAGTVPISSELQLADEELERIFLHLSTLDPAAPGDDGAFTLTEVAVRVREALVVGGEMVTGRYDALLAAAGFQFDDDYSDAAWVGGERSIYYVAAEFPRLTPVSLPAAVTNVRYALSLADAGSFVVAPTELRAMLAGSKR